MAEEINNNVNKGKKRTALKILRWVGFIFLLVLTVVLTVNSLLCVFVKHYYPTFGKYRLFAIVSDSMEPEIPTGDMIVGRVPDSESDIEVGTVITYELTQGNSITLITHRVISIGVNADGETVYATRGDNAGGVDAYRPVFKDVVGIYTGNKCGFFGYFFGFLQSSAGAIALIIILLIIALTWIIIYFVNLVSIWRKIAVTALKKSGNVLADTRIDELETLADVIAIVAKEPETKLDMNRKDKKLRWFLRTGSLPKRPYRDDIFDDMAFLNTVEATELILDLVKKSKEGQDVLPQQTQSEIIKEEEVAAEVVPEEITEAPVEVVEEPVEEIVEEPAEVIYEEPPITVESILLEAEEEPEDEESETEVLSEEEEPHEEVRSVNTATGMAIIVRYKKSFTAKLIQSDDKTKAYYSMLKNELLSYKKVKNRLSWNHENFNSGRNNIVRFTVRGKTLCVYFALNPADYEGTKYKVTHAESKKYENIPCLYRIKNARRAKYALDLIAAVAEKYGLEKGEQQNVNYYMRYEPTQPLIDRRLIKELISEEALEKPAEAVEEPVVEVIEEVGGEAVELTHEEVIAEPVEEVYEEEPLTEEIYEEEQPITVESILLEAEEEPEDEEPESEVLPEEEEPHEEVRSVNSATGMAIIVRYKKSFTAKLIQSDDKAKAYYSMLKNELLSYKKVKNRLSWNHENFNSGRNNIVRFTVRGKTLCVYFALNPADYEGTKYKVTHAESKKYENIPCLYRIKNARRAKYALDLIAAVAEKYGLKKGEQQNVNYYMRYEPTRPLIDRGLIKELISEEDYAAFMRQYSQREVDKNRREFVSAQEVNSVITDEVAIALVEDKSEEYIVKTKVSGKKGIVNVDTLSKNFAKNETVNLQALKAKGLVAKNVGSVKVLARGTLDKPLIVEANDFSIEAVKMIVLTGGKATKV